MLPILENKGHCNAIGMQCMQLYDNATYLMHYNALKTSYSAIAT